MDLLICFAFFAAMLFCFICFVACCVYGVVGGAMIFGFFIGCGLLALWMDGFFEAL